MLASQERVFPRQYKRLPRGGAQDELDGSRRS